MVFVGLGRYRVAYVLGYICLHSLKQQYLLFQLSLIHFHGRSTRCAPDIEVVSWANAGGYYFHAVSNLTFFSYAFKYRMRIEYGIIIFSKRRANLASCHIRRNFGEDAMQSRRFSLYPNGNGGFGKWNVGNLNTYTCSAN